MCRYSYSEMRCDYCHCGATAGSFHHHYCHYNYAANVITLQAVSDASLPSLRTTVVKTAPATDEMWVICVVITTNGGPLGIIATP